MYPKSAALRQQESKLLVGKEGTDLGWGEQRMGRVGSGKAELGAPLHLPPRPAYLLLNRKKGNSNDGWYWTINTISKQMILKTAQRNTK